MGFAYLGGNANANKQAVWGSLCSDCDGNTGFRVPGRAAVHGAYFRFGTNRLFCVSEPSSRSPDQDTGGLFSRFHASGEVLASGSLNIVVLVKALFPAELLHASVFTEQNP